MKKIPDPITNKKSKPKIATTHYIFVVDESGSIASSHLIKPLTEQLHSMARGIIEAVKTENKKKDKKVEQAATATLITFGHPVARAYTQFVRQPVERLLDYVTHGTDGTPLFDSVAEGIESATTYEQSLDKDDDVSFVVITITDGCEMHSVRYNAKTLKTLFEAKIATDRWTFAWQLPHIYVDRFVNQFQFDRGSILPWSTTDEGVEEATRFTVAATQDFMASRAMGVRSSKTYYQPNAANLTKKEVKNTLSEILPSNVRAWTVDKETDIKSFVEDHKHPFVIGASYYLLTKKEKVHHHKHLILVPRGEKKYYAGKEDARELLGLAPSGEIYLEPGNHGDWFIYVQSTSNNRKLVRGTQLLYRLDVTSGSAPETWDSKKAHEDAVKKHLEIAANANNTIDARVFGAIYGGKNKIKLIENALLANVAVKHVEKAREKLKVDNVLKRLKSAGLVEYTGAAADKGWVVKKGAKAPK